MDSKEKMSRALGTAYLSHQVAQLEKNVTNTGNNNAIRGGGRRGGRGGGGRGRGGIAGGHQPRRSAEDANERNANGHKANVAGGGGNRALSTSPTNAVRAPAPTKPADRIVVDPSVLIHAPGKFRAWCRESSQEVIIVPLEALNTLDLLKKGTSALAVRARNASRTLEAQVGVNPRIHVQQDHGYVPWEDVFRSTSRSNDTTRNRLSSDSALTDVSSSEDSVGKSVSTVRGEPPEWLKRTICCAKYEANMGDQVVLAVCSALDKNSLSSGGGNRFENRASGDLARQWAAKVGLALLEVDADDDTANRYKSIKNAVEDAIRPPSAALAPNRSPRVSRVDDDVEDSLHLGDDAAATHHRKISGLSGWGTPAAAPEVAWSPPSPKRSSFGQSGGHRGRKGSGLGTIGGGNLVEKPSAPVKLTNDGLLPAGKVIRLLARGEKLEP